MDARGRLGWAAVRAVTTAVLLVGGSVAWAAADEDDPAPTTTEHVDDAAAIEHEQTHVDDQGDDGGPGRRGRRQGHEHEALPPYEERYADATEEEQDAADDLIAEVEATLAAYADVDDAVAAGYQLPRDRVHPRSPLLHYSDPAVAEEDHVLDPERPNGLVYTAGGDGEPVLLGAFFVARPGVDAPTPAGDLVVWHSHSPDCPAFFATEDEPCTDTRRMLHVWTADEVELTGPRRPEPVTVRVLDPFGAPFFDSVERVEP
jgi:hypothetical protein